MIPATPDSDSAAVEHSRYLFGTEPGQAPQPGYGGAGDDELDVPAHLVWTDDGVAAGLPIGQPAQ